MVPALSTITVFHRHHRRQVADLYRGYEDRRKRAGTACKVAAPPLID